MTEVSDGLHRRRRYRRNRSLRGGRRAVVSVVGTLLALLVFFALFGIFVTQYVPVWMGDNESTFSASIQASLAQLKSNVDLQTTLGGPPSFSTPFTLASQGIPLIAAPTTATMDFTPRAAGTWINVSMQYGPSGKPGFYQNVSLGTIQVSVPNRYYTPQLYEYESDAVIQSQGDTNQLVLYPPLLAVNHTGGYSAGTLGLVEFYGNATQVVSTGTIEVYSHLGNIQSFPSNGTPAAPGQSFNVTITLGTLYPCAWATYLSGTLAKAGLPSGGYTLSPSTCVASGGQSTIVKLVLLHLNSFDLILASFTIAIGVGQS
ncbi:MAG TPA: hypothetical protein VGV89_10600 [Thermoplasmata archaeon]|nr:hypothetical protein [Thermoplasmata archaeon]